MAPEALAALEGDLRALNGMALLRRTEFSRVDLDFVVGLDCYGQVKGRDADATVPLFLLPPPSATSHEAADPDGGGSGESNTACDHTGPGCAHHEHAHTREVMTLALVAPGLEVDVDRVRRWLGRLLWREEEEEEEEGEGERGQQGHGRQLGRQTEIYRMKGVLAVAGSGAVHILQAVHETFEVEPSRTLTWGEGTLPRECRVVVIGKGLDEGALRRGLLATSAGEWV